jgi:hypothetical protein
MAQLAMVDAYRSKKQLRGVKADTARAFGCPKSAVTIRKVEGYLPWGVFVDGKKCRVAPRQFAGLPEQHQQDARVLVREVRGALKTFRKELKRGACREAFSALIKAQGRGGKALLSRHYGSKGRGTFGSGLAKALSSAQVKFASKCIVRGR